MLNKLTARTTRLFYLRATAQFGWSRAVLLSQIKAQTFERAKSEKKTPNFAVALPEHFAEQADEMLKSRHNLEFLGLARPMRERELEEKLIGRLQHFILELGYGFCFIGRQYRLALGQEDYFVDLLFYHRFLKTFVAFDLKVTAFEPEFAGKMDFYLNLLNEKERAPDDRPSIGITLCAEKDDVEVEFALKFKPTRSASLNTNYSQNSPPNSAESCPRRSNSPTSSARCDRLGPPRRLPPSPPR